MIGTGCGDCAPRTPAATTRTRAVPAANLSMRRILSPATTALPPVRAGDDLLEDIGNCGRQLFVRLLDALLEVLLPVFRPGPAVIVNEARIARRELRWPAVHVRHVAQTFDERVTKGGAVVLLRPVPAHRRSQRSDEGLRVVEDGLDRQAGKCAIGILTRRDDLDGLELAAVLE